MLRLLKPNRPGRAVPNNQIAAGAGTGERLIEIISASTKPSSVPSVKSRNAEIELNLLRSGGVSSNASELIAVPVPSKD